MRVKLLNETHFTITTTVSLKHIFTIMYKSLGCCVSALCYTPIISLLYYSCCIISLFLYYKTRTKSYLLKDACHTKNIAKQTNEQCKNK